LSHGWWTLTQLSSSHLTTASSSFACSTVPNSPVGFPKSPNPSTRSPGVNSWSLAEGSASDGFLARSESGVAPGYDRGGWGALCSLGIGLLVIWVIFHCCFPRGQSSGLRCDCSSPQSIQHRLGKNGSAGPNCTVLTIKLAKCGSSRPVRATSTAIAAIELGGPMSARKSRSVNFLRITARIRSQSCRARRTNRALKAVQSDQTSVFGTSIMLRREEVRRPLQRPV
jgi:hypothetical protein